MNKNKKGISQDPQFVNMNGIFPGKPAKRACPVKKMTRQQRERNIYDGLKEIYPDIDFLITSMANSVKLEDLGLLAVINGPSWIKEPIIKRLTQD